jgi:recombination protein RecA
MGVSFGNPESMPGGKGLQFYSSLMVRVRRGAWITDSTSTGEDEKDANRIGFNLKLRTEKNKLAPPWKTAQLEFKFDGTIEPIGALIRLAIEKNVITVNGPGYYEVPTIEGKVHGLDNLKALIKEDELLEDIIVQRIKDNSLQGEPF